MIGYCSKHKCHNYTDDNCHKCNLETVQRQAKEIEIYRDAFEVLMDPIKKQKSLDNIASSYISAMNSIEVDLAKQELEKLRGENE